MRNSLPSLGQALNALYTPEKKQKRSQEIINGLNYKDTLQPDHLQMFLQDTAQPGLQEIIRQDTIDQQAHDYLQLSLAFYKDTLGQSQLSFYVALSASVAAAILFIVVILMLLKTPPFSITDTTVTTYGTIFLGIGGAISGLVSGVCFYVYGVAASQFSAFHSRLDRLQRIFIAESLCGSISQGENDELAYRTMAKLVKIIAKSPLADSQMFVQPLQVGAGSGSGSSS